jgi:hypothetical protein
MRAPGNQIGRRITAGYRRTFDSYQGLSTRSKATLWIAALVLLLLILPQALRQLQPSNLSDARVYFSAPGSGITPGQIFPVEVRVQTKGSAVNAVATVVHFNPFLLEVVNMTTEKSFCTFYLENTFDTIKGEVRVSCGVPTPGFQGDSVIVHMNMRAKAAGNIQITLDPDRTQVLANDGKGTNITQDLPKLELEIRQSL